MTWGWYGSYDHYLTTYIYLFSIIIHPFLKFFYLVLTYFQSNYKPYLYTSWKKIFLIIFLSYLILVWRKTVHFSAFFEHSRPKKNLEFFFRILSYLIQKYSIQFLKRDIVRHNWKRFEWVIIFFARWQKLETQTLDPGITFAF